MFNFKKEKSKYFVKYRFDSYSYEYEVGLVCDNKIFENQTKFHIIYFGLVINNMLVFDKDTNEGVYQEVYETLIKILKDYYENELDEEFTNYMIGKFSGDNAESKTQYVSNLLKLEFGEENISIEDGTIKIKK